MDYLILLIAFGLLVLTRKVLTEIIFSILFRIAKNPRLVAAIYAVLFFPGVFLHELSHWLSAKLLRVPTHRFSLLPKWVGSSTLRFGYVEMTKTDSLRSAVIGMAPLLVGSAVILWMALNPLALGDWFNGNVEWESEGLLEAISNLGAVENLWIWLYLLFAISNSMLPSASDRSAWLPAILILFILGVVVVLIGFAPFATSLIEVPLGQLAIALRNAFLIALAFDIVLLPPVWLFDRALQRIKQ